MSSDPPSTTTVDLMPGTGGSDASRTDHDDTRQIIGSKVRERLFSGASKASRIGRYRVLEQIGRGGMGVVYAAYDEQLDRKVAIKVLLEDELPEQSEQRRFQREAQALARLSHPHVVTVHEVGESDGTIFLAMEYVRGKSFRQWLRTEPGPMAVLEGFLRAGRGLAAAHAAGLVHRDFKPANIMRGEDGAVKVLDFGLARAAADELDEELGTVDPEADSSESSTQPRSASSSMSALSTQLTQTGSVMGTPAYMAPEQFEGNAIDARSDQYSFCVALWEGLAGARPFEGHGLDNLIRAKLAGPPAWPEAAPAGMRPIVEALQRGLAVDPQDRWPTMEALLEALDQDPGRRRTRLFVGLTGVAMLGLGGVATQAWFETRTERCSGARQQLEGIWDDERRAQVEEAMLRGEESYAPAAWERTSRELDAYGDAWVAMHTDACEATTVRGEQSARVLDLRMRCLHRAAASLEAAVNTLADADTTVVSQAHELVSGLRPLPRCADMEVLDAEVEPPLPAEADAVRQATQHLARAKSEREAWRFVRAQTEVDAATQAVEGIEYGPVHAELMLEQGKLYVARNELAKAEPVLSEAVQRASRWGLRVLAAEAAIDMMLIWGREREQIPVAAPFVQGLLSLRPFIEGLTEDDPALHATYRSVLGIVLNRGELYEEGLAEHRAVLQARLDLLGPDHFDVSVSYSDLGSTLHLLDKEDESLAAYQAGLDIRERLLGPKHPATLEVRNNVAVALSRLGRLEEAVTEFRRLLPSANEAQPSDQGKVARTRANLAYSLTQMKRYDEAEVEHRAAIAGMVAGKGADYLTTAELRWNFAESLEAAGKYAEAEAQLRLALETYMASLGPQHPYIPESRMIIARLLLAQGKPQPAEAEARQALALSETIHGPDHAETAKVRELLAQIVAALDPGAPP